MGVMDYRIRAGAAGVVYDYNVPYSCRFNAGDDPYLSRTPASASNRKTWTYSCWFKKDTNSGSADSPTLLYAGDESGSDAFQLYFIRSNNHALSDKLFVYQTATVLETDQLFRDPAAWYHVVLGVDTTQATAADRVKLYINGDQVTAFDTATYPSQNADWDVNNDNIHVIGSSYYSSSAGESIGGYLADVYLIDGQALTPSSFGVTNSDTNQWEAKSFSGSYGTNGFRLSFSNSAALGTDSSGNGNDYAVTNLVATDQIPDGPKASDSGVGSTSAGGNFATMNPLINPYSGLTYSEGNLKISKAANYYAQASATLSLPNSGKWYWEMNRATASGTGWMGIAGSDATLFWDSANTPYLDTIANCLFYDDAKYYVDGSNTGTYGVTWYDSNLMSIALNLDDNEMTLYKNNVSQGVATISGGILTAAVIVPVDLIYGTEVRDYNFGQNGTFNGTKTAGGNADDNGIGDFFYAPPTGFLALCSKNLAEPTIIKPSEHFNTHLYTGDGTTNNPQTGIGFQPDMIWIKDRDATNPPVAVDSIRGVGQVMYTNSDVIEATRANSVTAFGADGFTVKDDDYTNETDNAFVSWCWKFGGSSLTTNTAGDITSYNSVNSTAGMSLSKYTGLGPGGTTLGHGLSVAPNFVMIKGYTGASNNNWYLWREGLKTYSGIDNGTLVINSSNAMTETGWNASVLPTSTLVKVANSSAWNAVDYDYIIWCMYEVDGFSKTGKYEGNNLTDGTFVYCGFRPAFLFLKSVDGSAHWEMEDDKRDPYNMNYHSLQANLNYVENTTATRNGLDFLSNGFKFRDNESNVMNGLETYFYMAFAESPFKYSNAR